MFKQVKGNLFDHVEEDDKNTPFAFAHCVSHCLAMGKGIAPEFKRRYERVDELERQPHEVGDAPHLHFPQASPAASEPSLVLYLITKQMYYHKPTYKTMEQALRSARTVLEQYGISHVAIPLIGCGLDRLEWEQVKLLVQQEWMDHGITVTLHTL